MLRAVIQTLDNITGAPTERYRGCRIATNNGSFNKITCSSRLLPTRVPHPWEGKHARSCLISFELCEIPFRFWKAFSCYFFSDQQYGTKRHNTRKSATSCCFFAFNTTVENSVAIVGMSTVAGKLLINVQLSAHAHNLVLLRHYQSQYGARSTSRGSCNMVQSSNDCALSLQVGSLRCH